MWMCGWRVVTRAVKINMLIVWIFILFFLNTFLKIFNEMNAASFGWRYIRLYEHAIKHNKTQKRR